ncbi:phytoene/squalene synthase family protein [Algihabitans albus]|uniref:phytoene/squalene synthase family protein n=1 Tax=Algihabitans albus TaxID=2164067 RepID=UPI000E5CFCE6|nr:phytoene/squalene synthase family protein [Algihabitans albus]
MLARAADRTACRSLIRQGSKSFYLASLLLPARMREPAYALYAFCRLADDAVDEQAGGCGLAAVARLRDRLERVYDGRPENVAVDRAFTEVIERYAIPHVLPEALIEGFAWDAQGRSYETFSDVLAYGVRVAGSVGAMMALLMGARSPEAVSRACDLGVAMQLTNIARDVGEDARAGRLYLPQAWLREAGIDPATWLAAPGFQPEIGEIVARLLAAAEGLYLRAGPGIAGLPAACRPGIYAARYLYAEIGREVARRGHDSVSSRAVVARGRQQVLLWRALASSAAPTNAPNCAPLAEAGYLVEAVAGAPLRRRSVGAQNPWWHLGANIGAGLEILGRLEEREREGQAAAAASSGSVEAAGQG